MKLSISKDKNGNKIVRVSPTDGRGFSIQTNGNLPYIHANGISSPYYAKLEVWDYVSRFGTEKQKQVIGQEKPVPVSRFAYDLHQMKLSSSNTMNPTAKKAPAMFTVAQVEFYETLARVSIRRLFPMRSRSDAREAIRGWVGTLRDAKRIRAYRNF